MYVGLNCFKIFVWVLFQASPHFFVRTTPLPRTPCCCILVAPSNSSTEQRRIYLLNSSSSSSGACGLSRCGRAERHLAGSGDNNDNYLAHRSLRGWSLPSWTLTPSADSPPSSSHSVTPGNASANPNFSSWGWSGVGGTCVCDRVAAEQ